MKEERSSESYLSRLLKIKSSSMHMHTFLETEGGVMNDQKKNSLQRERLETAGVQTGSNPAHARRLSLNIPRASIEFSCLEESNTSPYLSVKLCLESFLGFDYLLMVSTVYSNSSLNFPIALSL